MNNEEEDLRQFSDECQPEGSRINYSQVFVGGSFVTNEQIDGTVLGIYQHHTAVSGDLLGHSSPYNFWPEYNNFNGRGVRNVLTLLM